LSIRGTPTEVVPARPTHKNRRRPMTIQSSTRRRILAAGSAVAGASALGFPMIGRTQTRELVIGGAASHKAFLSPTILPSFETKYKCKVIFEGTRSLTNLEKMVNNKSKPYLSVVMMDDPVMLQAVKEGVIEKMDPAKAPNIARLKPEAIHQAGMWANYQQPYTGIAFNTQRVKTAPTSWNDLWAPANKGKVIIPSLQNTEGLATFFMAGTLATGKKPKDAQYDTDAAFKKLRELKPNLLTVYAQMTQAFNLLEQGEAWMIGGALSSFALLRKKEGAPIDMVTLKEGSMGMPSGIAKVTNGPHADLAYAFINDMLGEYQTELATLAFALPTNTTVKPPAGFPSVEIFIPDWANVAAKRGEWVQRWDKDMSA
jgi:putative spermidine/putrescine transport system substrate-binding protein